MSKNIDQFVYAHQLNERLQIKTLQASDVSTWVSWETCIRKFLFLPDPHNVPKEDFNRLGFDLYQGQQALEFLLEVLCGAHSRIFGENEIFGQFKKLHAEGKLEEVPFLRNPEFLSFIYNATKTVRSENFINSGSNSYGSYLRKATKNESEISIIGKGQLSKKLQEWLSEKNVRLHGRNPESFAGVLVVAAPVETATLQKWIEQFGHNVKSIYDFRALDNTQTSLRSFWQKDLCELSEIFSQLEIDQDEKRERFLKVRKQIQELVNAWLMKAQHRPQGWDDLCT